MALKILLSGATGKVGRQIESLVEQDDGLEIVARASRDSFFDEAGDGDVIVDFSRPDACVRAVEFGREHGLPCITGTTGLSASQQRRIDDAAGVVAVCQAANFSIGVNLLLELVARASGGLGAAFDAEILELHHRFKVDAPSGTALALGRAVARGRGDEAPSAAAPGRAGPRRAGEIGYLSGRGGDVAGEHTVLFLGDGERLELIHRASDRAVFARGALRAARWLVGRDPGLYSMSDVVG
ncbi:MAG: 4-hydroxy-tetrahydrodipicolinate reductase [Candidatus Wenzhouxiangella sp. M2_3B_020]